MKENNDIIGGFRDPSRAESLLQKIIQMAGGLNQQITLMEVCGTHTTAIFQSGIKTLLPPSIKLVSGPGCPVCVTPNQYLDRAIALSRLEDVIITTFGDMMRVPGSSSSLEKEKTRGSDVRVVYSTLDALRIARDDRAEKVVFLGVGFETTSPTVASVLKQTRKENVENFLVLCAHKLIPPAMAFLAQSPDLRVDGFLCPGHVSTIIGTKPYEFLAREHQIPCVIAGFEPLDVLQGILLLVQQIVEGKHLVQNQYRRVVAPEGNPKAMNLVSEVFDPLDSLWRGIGVILGSGLKIKEDYARFDAENQIEVEVEPSFEPQACLCGEVIQGKKQPTDCGLFARDCSPESPVGPCMVSSEGTCAVYYKYGQN
ncbi:MAG: hydrogenase formation protein HypD [Candidatus Zixiibacteriota bacterium]